jgi:pimeloyl-ACP methyl ester carboxylesterase
MRFLVILAALLMAEVAAASTLAPVDCWFEVPKDRSSACYHLAVPSSRDGERDGTIILPVAVLSHAGGAKHPDPVVYLTGGPGSSVGLTNDEMPGWWSYLDHVPWLAGRDLVLMDQRGSGLSRPSLDCPEIERAGLRLLKLSGEREKRKEIYRAASEACHRRFLDAGYDLDDFTTEATADDFIDLVAALGLQDWNIYSVSYGTRLALTLMKRKPSGLRAAVLDSVYPPDAREYEDRRATYDQALDRLSEACARREACRADFPDLRQAIDEAIARYNRTPVTIRIEHAGEMHDIAFTGALLAEHVFYLVIESGAVDEVPEILKRVAAGEEAAFVEIATTLASTYSDANHFGEGKYYVVECQEEVPFTDAARMAADIAAQPLLDNYGIVADDFHACSVWVRAGASAAVKEPVASDIPALVLQGTFDAISPVSSGKGTAARLPKGFYLEFPEVGHKVVDQSQCGQRIAADFLDNPGVKPTATCLAEPPRPPEW